MDGLASNSMCRLCLRSVDNTDSLKNLRHHDIDLLQILIGIQFLDDDELKKICLDCFQTLDIIHNFTERCKKNQQIITSRLQTNEKSYKEDIHLDNLDDNHKNNEQRKLFSCTYCSRKFKFKSKFNQHIYRHKLKLGLIQVQLEYAEKRSILKLECHLCDKVFSSRSGFQYHQHKHDKKPPHKTTKLLKHEKTFLCNYCAKSFYMKTHLDEHLRIHTGEKPFKCKCCSKEFRQKSALNRHEISHKGKPIPLFPCEQCHKTFTTKAHRDIHSRLHSGLKPYECEFCKKCFNYKTQWRIHLRLHTGESPFTCEICHNSYHDKGSLRKHQKRKSHGNG